MDNLRHNHGALYQLSTEATNVLNRLNGPNRAAVQKALGRPEGEDIKDSPGRDSGRLFFLLSGAEEIAKCLLNVPPHKESTKGALIDLWDQGFSTGMAPVSAYELAMLLPLAVGLLVRLSWPFWDNTGVRRRFWECAAYRRLCLVPRRPGLGRLAD